MALSEDFKYSVNKLGEPVIYDKPVEEDLGLWSGRVPETLIDFWRAYGWTQFLKGRLWLPDPDDFAPLMEVLFEGDPDIDPTTCHLIAYSAFGDLYIWSEQYQAINISPNQGWIYASGLTDNDFADDPNMIASFPFYSNVKTGYNAMDEKGKPLYNRAVKKYGALESGECFGFVPALALGGSGNLDEIQRVKALEHFILVSQLQPLTLMTWEGTTMKAIRPIGEG